MPGRGRAAARVVLTQDKPISLTRASIWKRIHKAGAHIDEAGLRLILETAETLEKLCQEKLTTNLPVLFLGLALSQHWG